MYEIIPGILEKDWKEIERKINLVKSFTKTIHIDIVDGIFAQNQTFIDPLPFKKFTHSSLRSSGQALLFEAHLMVDDPINYLRPFAEAGFKRFLGHVEKMSDQAEFVAQGQLLGEVGLVIDGPTNVDSIRVPFDDLDTLVVMTIKAGLSGQAFIPEYLKKIEILRSALQNQDDTKIEIDGGVNGETIVLAKNAGATRFVANSFLFKGNNPEVQYKILEEKLEKPA